MKILKRLGYYLVGMAIGLVLLAVFVKGKKGEGGFWDDFAYTPNARVLKSLGNMPYTLSAKAKQHHLSREIDSATLSHFYKSGKVDFSKSDTRKSDCLRDYTVTGNALKQDLQVFLSLNICDSLVEIKDINVLN